MPRIEDTRCLDRLILDHFTLDITESKINLKLVLNQFYIYLDLICTTNRLILVLIKTLMCKNDKV